MVVTVVVVDLLVLIQCQNLVMIIQILIEEDVQIQIQIEIEMLEYSGVIYEFSNWIWLIDSFIDWCVMIAWICWDLIHCSTRIHFNFTQLPEMNLSSSVEYSLENFLENLWQILENSQTKILVFFFR